jgi:hypothetical protein
MTLNIIAELCHAECHSWCVIYAEYRKSALSAECRYAECRYAECLVYGKKCFITLAQD